MAPLVYKGVIEFLEINPPNWIRIIPNVPQLSGASTCQDLSYW